MILIDLTADENGIIKSVSSLGHEPSGREKGESGIVCSAVSSLLRTYAICLESDNSVKLSGKAPARGGFYLRIDKYAESSRQWICGLSSFLAKGLNLIKEDFPESVTIVTRDE